jgi:VIT1/CCC1 family predicted Fe2+/Mn2+ transporter
VAVVSLVSFLLGAFLPVLPWLGGSGDGARLASVVIGIAAAAVLGALIARQSERSWVMGSARQIGITVLAVIVTYLIGSLVGVNVS